MKNTGIRLISFFVAVVLAVATLCACTKQTETDTPKEKTQGKYAAEADTALTLINKALENNQFKMVRTTSSYTAEVVSEGKSLYVSTQSEEENEANLWEYVDGLHCRLYTNTDGTWKQYETKTSEHEWNISRPRASYFPILEQLHDAIAYDGATPDEDGIYHFVFDDPVTLYVENGNLYITGESGIFNGKTVVSEIGTATVVVTEEMQNAPQEEYHFSQF